jgi:hypothetical protein
MKTLTLHELSLQDMPEDGLPIIFFTSTSSFGMFEQHLTKQGNAEYMYGDIADSLEEAIQLGGFICLSRSHEDDELAIPLLVDDTYLYEGCLWMYEHEYYPVLDPDHFPFQDWYYYKWAEKNGLIDVVCIDSERVEHPDHGILLFVDHRVLYNDKEWVVCWTKRTGEDEFSMLRYTLMEDVEDE